MNWLQRIFHRRCIEREQKIHVEHYNYVEQVYLEGIARGVQMMMEDLAPKMPSEFQTGTGADLQSMRTAANQAFHRLRIGNPHPDDVVDALRMAIKKPASPTPDEVMAVVQPALNKARPAGVPCFTLKQTEGEDTMLIALVGNGHSHGGYGVAFRQRFRLLPDGGIKISPELA